MVRLEELSIDLPGFRLHPLNLSVKEGEFFMVVGPSGAGKTLLLEVLAGLMPASGGRVMLRERDVTMLPPEQRTLSIVYQDFALFPHLTVRDNIRYGLRFRNHEGSEQLFGHLVEVLKLDRLLHRLPTNLSGGEQQRVALARALVVKPDMLLLDEPLSALDPKFRLEIQEYLRKLHSEGITFLMVSHDFGEVLSLGDRVAVLHEGKLQQVGGVSDVFRAPSNRFVADFVGMTNILRPSEVNGNRIAFPGGFGFSVSGPLPAAVREIGIRPEDILISRSPKGTDPFEATVRYVNPMGSAFDVGLQAGPLTLRALAMSSAVLDMGLKPGETVWAGIRTESIHVF